MWTNSCLRAVRALSVLMLVAALAACDNPVGESDHEEAAGLVVRQGTTVLVRVEGTVVSGPGLTVPAGEETPHLTVFMLAEDGDEFTPDDDYYLEVVFGDDDVAAWEHDTPGGFGGHLHGGAVGSTTIEFRLMHGAVGSGHEDYSTPDGAITVTVTQ